MSLAAFKGLSQRASCHQPAKQGLRVKTESLRRLLRSIPSATAYATTHPDIPLALRANIRGMLSQVLDEYETQHGNTVPNAKSNRFMAKVYRESERGFRKAQYFDLNDEDEEVVQPQPRHGRKGGASNRRANRRRSRSGR